MDCFTKRKEVDVFSEGIPKRKYTKPLGWARFMLASTPRAEAQNIWKTYHVAYHGTIVDAVRPILDAGGLLLPGTNLQNPVGNGYSKGEGNNS